MKKFTILLVLALGLAFASGCATPETRIAQQPELFKRLTPEQQQLVKEGRVGIGFDMAMVRLALGDPDRVRERVDASGQSEVWAYVEYEGANGALLYRGWYHRGGWGGIGYPYYLNVEGRHERARVRVVFREGRVTSVETEKR